MKINEKNLVTASAMVKMIIPDEINHSDLTCKIEVFEKEPPSDELVEKTRLDVMNFLETVDVILPMLECRSWREFTKKMVDKYFELFSETLFVRHKVDELVTVSECQQVCYSIKGKFDKLEIVDMDLESYPEEDAA